MSQRIAIDECLMCQSSLFKGMSLLSIVIEDSLCSRCRSLMKLRLKKRRFEGCALYTMYDYENIKHQLIRYKDYLDIPLSQIFIKPYIWIVNKVFRDYTIVVIPSSDIMLKRRGFHHLLGMLEGCTLEVVSCLEKDDTVQRFSRQRTVTFTLKTSVTFDKVIIFDDVITSGNSMRAALELLKPISSKIVLFSISDNYEEGVIEC